MLTLSAPKESNGGAVRTRRRTAKEFVLNFTPRRFFNLLAKKQETDVCAHIPLCRTFNTAAE
jgi:hypothetical protein